MGDSTGRLYDLKITPGKGQGWKFLTPPLYLMERAELVAKCDENYYPEELFQLSVTPSAELDKTHSNETQLSVTPSAELFRDKFSKLGPEVIETYDGTKYYLQTYYVQKIPKYIPTLYNYSSNLLQSQYSNTPLLQHHSNHPNTPLKDTETARIEDDVYPQEILSSRPSINISLPVMPPINIRLISGGATVVSNISLYDELSDDEIDSLQDPQAVKNKEETSKETTLKSCIVGKMPSLPFNNQNGTSDNSKLMKIEVKVEVVTPNLNYINKSNLNNLTMSNENNFYVPNSSFSNSNMGPLNPNLSQAHPNTFQDPFNPGPNQGSDPSQTFRQQSTHGQPQPGQSGTITKEDLQMMFAQQNIQMQSMVETSVSRSIGDINTKLVQQDANLPYLKDQFLLLKEEVQTSRKDIQEVKVESRKAHELSKQAVQRGGGRGRNNQSVLHVSGWKIENDGKPYLPRRGHDIPDEFFEVFAKIEKVDEQRCNLYTREGFTFYMLSWVMARNWGKFTTKCPNLDIRSLAERNDNKAMMDKPVFADMRPWAEVKKGRIVLENEDF